MSASHGHGRACRVDNWSEMWNVMSHGRTGLVQNDVVVALLPPDDVALVFDRALIGLEQA